MNIAIEESGNYSHASGPTGNQFVDSAIYQGITKPTEQLRKMVNDILAAPQSERDKIPFSKEVLKAYQDELAKRDAGGAATVRLNAYQTLVAETKQLSKEMLIKQLEARKLQLKRMQDRMPPASAADLKLVMDYITVYEAELATRPADAPIIDPETDASDTIWGIPKIPFIVGASLLGLIVLTVGGAFAYKAVKN